MPRRFEVREIHNGFVVADSLSGEERHIGDGVDVFEDIGPGEPWFTEWWTRELNANPDEVAEAYGFPPE